MLQAHRARVPSCYGGSLATAWYTSSLCHNDLTQDFKESIKPILIPCWHPLLIRFVFSHFGYFFPSFVHVPFHDWCSSIELSNLNFLKVRKLLSKRVQKVLEILTKLIQINKHNNLFHFTENKIVFFFLTTRV